jgi:hypothetical protein
MKMAIPVSAEKADGTLALKKPADRDRAWPTAANAAIARRTDAVKAVPRWNPLEKVLHEITNPGRKRESGEDSF